MIATQKNRLKHLKPNEHKALDLLCFYCKNLYNVGLYNVRSYYFETCTKVEKITLENGKVIERKSGGKYLPYYNKETKLDNYHLSYPNENFKLLLAQSSKEILREVDENFKSFFAILKLKKSGKIENKLNIPHYKDKEGRHILTITGQDSYFFKKGTKNYFRFGLSKTFVAQHPELGLKEICILAPDFVSKDNIKEVRIIPKGNDFEIEYVYEKKEIAKPNLDKYKSLGIDLGLDNLCACLDTEGNSFLICGRRLKQHNHRYNKILAQRKSHLKKVYDKNYSNFLSNLDKKRYWFINDYFNKVVCVLINHCLEHKIGRIIVGENKGQKQKINLGTVNNQNFVQIPLCKLKKKLSFKCDFFGISFETTEESYTSKASFVDNDIMPKQYEEGKKYTFSGKRVKRGLYVSKNGIKINADVNGAGNILRKLSVKIDYKKITKALLGRSRNPNRIVIVK